MDDDEGFEATLHAISPESFHEGAVIPDAWVRWLRVVHDQEGPLPRDAVERRANRDIRAAAGVALQRVLDDFERVRGVRPHIELSDHDGLRVVYARAEGIAMEPPEGLATPSALDALVAVGTAVVDLLADDDPEMPLVCQHHGRGHLEPRAVNDRAIWWCGYGHHIVGEIGHLATTAL
jgi:hypothetical protein